jgi:uncharacterized protein (TIGR02246 family)
VEPWQLAAREAIRDLVARYNQLGDAGRTEPLVELFTADAVLKVPGRTLQGREAIRDFFSEVAGGTGRKPIRVLRHFVATHQIDLEAEDAATGRCYYQVLTEHGLDHWGRYLDRYERTQGGWRFAEREATVDAAVPGGWGASGLELPAGE